MAEIFKCPACSAPLSFEGKPIQQCKFCGGNVIVPGTVMNNFRAAGGEIDESPVGAPSPIHELPGQIAEVRRLLSEGKKIEAIKVFRETFGCGLKEAKDAVEAIERGESVSMTNFNPASSPTIDGVVVKKAGGSIVGTLVVALIFVVGVVVLALYMVSSSLNSYKGKIVSPTPRSVATPVQEKTSTPPSIAKELLKFGGEGIGPGKFTDNRTIAVDSDGHIYSADYSNGRVQAFDADGKFLQQYVPDATRTVDALGVDRKGNLFVLQGFDVFRVNRSSGEIAGKTRIDSATDLAVGADGRVYVSTRFGDVAILNSEGAKVGAVVLKKELGIQSPDQIAVDGAGNIFLVSQRDASIFKLAPDGKLLAKFGGRASGANRNSKTLFLSAPEDLAVDSQGRLYASDVSAVRIFDPNGAYLNSFDAPQTFGVTLNENDEVFTAARPFVVKYKVALQ